MAKIKRNNKQWSKTQAAATEIQENLLQISNEKVVGGDQLFFIDKAGNQENRKLGQLKSYEIMNNSSFIPPLVAKKAAKTTKTLVVVENGDGSTKEKKISKNILSTILENAKIKKAKNLIPGSALASKRKKVQEKKMHVKRCKGGFDLWDNEGETVTRDPLPARPEEIAQATTVKVARLPLCYSEKEISRPTKVPAVPLPHPGMSYQPTEKDQKDIIIAAADEELKKIAKKERVKEALAYPAELDLLEDDDGYFDESSEDEQEEEEVVSANEKSNEDGTELKKSARKLTKSEINRKLRHKQVLQEEKALQDQKALIKQINKLKDIQKSIESKENADEIKRKERQLKNMIKASSAPRRTSKFPFNPVPITAQLPEEVAGSLRELAPEGGLLKERFRNLQERGTIEVRVPVNMKKVQKKKWGRYKVVESHDYKRFK